LFTCGIVKGGQWSHISCRDQQAIPRTTITTTDAVCELLSFLHIVTILDSVSDILKYHSNADEFFCY